MSQTVNKSTYRCVSVGKLLSNLPVTVLNLFLLIQNLIIKYESNKDNFIKLACLLLDCQFYSIMTCISSIIIIIIIILIIQAVGQNQLGYVSHAKSKTLPPSMRFGWCLRQVLETSSLLFSVMIPNPWCIPCRRIKG